MNESIAVITKEEISKVESNALNIEQMNFLFAKTPKRFQYKRPAKGGGQWTYVTGTYVKKVLNLMFGFDWDFEIMEHKVDLEIKQIYVLGKLTCRVKNRTIVKMQFGRKDIAFKKDSEIPLDVGNDLKSATTDSLKKCASELGIASDVYAPSEFKELKVVDNDVSYQEKKVGERLIKFLSHAETVEDFEEIKATFEETATVTPYIQDIFDTQLNLFNLKEDNNEN